MKLLRCYIQNFGKLQDFSYEFQNGINNIQKVLGMLGDLTNKDTKETYKPRPIYKHFED